MESKLWVQINCVRCTGISYFQVSVQFSQAESRPGQVVSLTVQAAPESYIGILGVDKSVKLLGSGYDITREDVVNVSISKLPKHKL